MPTIFTTSCNCATNNDTVYEPLTQAYLLANQNAGTPIVNTGVKEAFNNIVLAITASTPPFNITITADNLSVNGDQYTVTDPLLLNIYVKAFIAASAGYNGAFFTKDYESDELISLQPLGIGDVITIIPGSST